MFTGIVEAVGEIVAVEPLGDGRTFRIRAAALADTLQPGESIAVDGACQTVVTVGEGTFSVESVATTLQRTSFGAFRPGRRVNLERAMALGDRLGGHLVQGHVDGVGEVLRVVPRGEHVLIDVRVPEEVAAVSVLHGSITVDGVSLTVNALPAPATVQLSIIPFTLEHTTLGTLEPGARVNLEGDLIGKHVRHLLRVHNRGNAADLPPFQGYTGA